LAPRAHRHRGRLPRVNQTRRRRQGRSTRCCVHASITSWSATPTLTGGATSLMWSAGRWDISPLYDVACTVAYPWLDAVPAMTIGACKKESDIAAEHFKCLLRRNASNPMAQGLKSWWHCRELGEAAAREARSLYEAIAPDVGESNAAFVREWILPWRRHAGASTLTASQARERNSSIGTVVNSAPGHTFSCRSLPAS